MNRKPGLFLVNLPLSGMSEELVPPLKMQRGPVASVLALFGSRLNPDGLCLSLLDVISSPCPNAAGV